MIAYKSKPAKPGVMKPCFNCGNYFHVMPCLAHKTKFCSTMCWKTRKPEARFWIKVDKSAPNGCWIWTGCAHGSGYKTTAFWNGKRVVTATRFSWELANGPIPNRLHVLHRCDNPMCVNPNHLFLGTHQDNMADKLSKGRQPRGEAMAFARLTEEAVRDIRANYKYKTSGFTVDAFAKKYSTAYGAVWSALHRKTWKHVPDLVL